MNDFWNDPPEYDEAPECPNCDEGYGEYLYDGENDKKQPVQVYSCDRCGYQWSILIPEDPDPEDFAMCEESAHIDYPPKCPHGAEWGECSACDHAGDLAYDAARERRVFGK